VNLPDDFRDMLACLSDAGVEFVVVGGYAVAHHGYVRATKDLDVFIRPSAENAARTMRAMSAFGAPVAALGVSAVDFSTPGKVVQLGVPPLRIDLVTALSGVDFDTATRSPSTLEIDGRVVNFIGLEALLTNKRAAARPQDLADVAALEALKRR
jgi:predicted nucleotidyltransferase